MAVPSLPVPLGSRLPWFDLTTLDGKQITTKTLLQQRPVLVLFLCQHSPYVRHIETELGAMVAGYTSRVTVLGVASNDERAYPADCAQALREQARRAGFTFDVGLDTYQRAAKSFGATCTPELFVYDDAWRLAYHGQFDSSRPDNDLPTDGADLRHALDAVLSKEGVVARDQRSSFGCSIKWTAGHEPAYIFSAFPGAVR